MGSITGCPLKCCDHEPTGASPALSAHDCDDDESHHFCLFVFCSSGSGFLTTETGTVFSTCESNDSVFVRIKTLLSLHQSDFFRPPIYIS